MFLCANAESEKGQTREALFQALDQNFHSLKDDLIADLTKYLKRQEEDLAKIRKEIKALDDDYGSFQDRVDTAGDNVDAISKAVKDVPVCEAKVGNLKKKDKQLQTEVKQALDCCHSKFSTTQKPTTTTTTTSSGKVCWQDFKTGLHDKHICAGGLLSNPREFNVKASEEEPNLGAAVINVCPVFKAMLMSEYSYTMMFWGWKDAVQGGTMIFKQTGGEDCNPRITWGSIKCGHKDGSLNVTKATHPSKCFYDVEMEYPCLC